MGFKKGNREWDNPNSKKNLFKDQGKKLEANCKFCKKKFKYYKVNKNGIFCSHKCLYAHRREKGFLRAEKNPNWKGGVNQDYYQRLAKDNFKQECSICKSTKNILVHHKNQDQKDNRLENLVVVCKSCHSLIHHRIRRQKNGRRL